MKGGGVMMMDTEPRGKVRRLIEKHKRGETLTVDELISLVGNFVGLLLDADLITVETLKEWIKQIEAGKWSDEAKRRRLVDGVADIGIDGALDPARAEAFLGLVTADRIKEEEDKIMGEFGVKAAHARVSDACRRIAGENGDEKAGDVALEVLKETYLKAVEARAGQEGVNYHFVLYVEPPGLKNK